MKYAFSYHTGTQQLTYHKAPTEGMFYTTSGILSTPIQADIDMIIDVFQFMTGIDFKLKKFEKFCILKRKEPVVQFFFSDE